MIVAVIVAVALIIAAVVTVVVVSEVAAVTYLNKLAVPLAASCSSIAVITVVAVAVTAAAREMRRVVDTQEKKMRAVKWHSGKVSSDLKHDVVWDVGLSVLHSLQGEWVPQVKEGPQVHQHWVGQVTNIHSPCEGRRTHADSVWVTHRAACSVAQWVDIFILFWTVTVTQLHRWVSGIEFCYAWVMLLSVHYYPQCAVHTFAEGCGYSQGTVLSRQVDSTGADDRPLLSVHHQNNPNKHTNKSLALKSTCEVNFLSFAFWFTHLLQDYFAWN